MQHTATLKRHPCTFTPAGADEEFCQRQSALLRHASRCANCASVWRICLRCIKEQTVDALKSRVVDAKNGLCAQHADPHDLASEEAESPRDGLMPSLGATGDQVVDIPLDLIRPRKDQPRQHFDEEELNNLARGLKRVGQQQPAIVVLIETDENGCQYELDDGERRWRAARMAGLRNLKCTIIPAHIDAGLRYLRSAVSNFNRAGHTLLEEVDMVVRLHEQEGFTQKVIAEALGKHPMWVTQRYSLRRLHPDVRKMLEPDLPRERRLGFPAALRLAVLQPEVQKEVAPSLVRANTNELTHIINQAARAGGFTVGRRNRAPSDDFRSIIRNTKTAADRVGLLVQMDNEDWENAFRYENRSNLIALAEQVERLEQQARLAVVRLRQQLDADGS